MKWIDNILDRTTMYRLVFYTLIAFILVAIGLGWAGQLQYSPISIGLSTLFLVGACWLTNRIFAWAFNIAPHDDSAYITALILALIISPYRTATDLPLLIWAPILAMAGKYIMALRRQHVFNPAALAVALTSLVIHQSASWWVGNVTMLPYVAIGGWLIVRKIRRWGVVIPFLIASLASIAFFTLLHHGSVPTAFHRTLVSSPLIYFSTIMLSEPLTMPPTKRWRLMYAVFIGVLFAPQFHVGSIYSTPELALLTGNALFWLVSRRGRFVLELKKIEQTAPNMFDFVFAGPNMPAFRAGQYFEWFLPHAPIDSRGQRRYFTVASSPTEKNFRLGVKFYPNPSSYKQALSNMKPGQTIVASQLDGDFTLPADPRQPLVFIAGGIGVTPFRSMIKYLLDHQQARPITMLYANNVESDIVYTDIFEQARAELGINTIYVLSDEKKIRTDWTGLRGFITPDMIQQQIPDYAQRTFYLSGPQGMVTAYEKVLASLGLPKKQIKTDYFPGFA